ncbi:MAG TPA: ice-binding family protein, partial [Anseongella sp.]|nr:ice-binding family protein [Anseongella sp.]
EGVYELGSVNMTDPLQLDGDSNSVFIFNIYGTLEVQAGASVVLNGVLPEHVFWNVQQPGLRSGTPPSGPQGAVAIYEDYFTGIVLANGDVYRLGSNEAKLSLLTMGLLQIDGGGSEPLYSARNMPGISGPDLGLAGGYGLLAGDYIDANTSIRVNGAVGSFSGISANITADSAVTATQDVNSALAVLQLLKDYCWLRNASEGQPINNNLNGQSLQGGFYFINGDAELQGGQLTFSGDSATVIVMNIDGNLELAGNALIGLNGVLPENIYWNVNGSVSLGEGAGSEGVFMSDAEIYYTGPSFGRKSLLSLQGFIDLTNNQSAGIGINKIYSREAAFKLGDMQPLAVCPPPPATWHNLIVNSNFEDFRNCPVNLEAITDNEATTDVCYWVSPRSPDIGGASTPDYFNACGTFFHGVPANLFGSQLSHLGGEAYAGLYVRAGIGEYREYIRQQLPPARALKKDRHYYGEFFASSARVSAYGIRDLTMYVTAQPP